MIFAVFLVIVLFFVYYAISPFFESAFRRKPVTGAEGQEELLMKKEEILAGISDLEYDFKMHKMNEADYLQLKERLTGEAIEVLKKIDTLEGRKNETAGIASGAIRARRKVRS